MTKLTRKFIHTTITAHDGQVYRSPLKLGEVAVLSQILHDNASVTCKLVEVSMKEWNRLFK
jgi:hypothetical protein